MAGYCVIDVLAIDFKEDVRRDKEIQKWLVGWGEIRFAVEVRDKEAHIDITIEESKKAQFKKQKQNGDGIKCLALNKSFPLPFPCDKIRLNIRLSHCSKIIASLMEVEGYSNARTEANRNKTNIPLHFNTGWVGSAIAKLHKKLCRKIIERIAIGYLVIDIHNLSADECAQFALKNILDLGSTKDAMLNECENLVDSAVNIRNGLEELRIPQFVKEAIANVRPFVMVMDTLSEAHPYLKLAWNVAAAAYKIVENQLSVDSDARNLLQSIMDALILLKDIEFVNYGLLVDSLSVPIQSIDRLVIESCIFLREYLRSNFSERTIKFGAAEKIKAFQSKMNTFKDNLIDGLLAQSEWKKEIDKLEGKLQKKVNDGFDRTTCLAGTRLETLQQIRAWQDDDAGETLLWLQGPAGVGKTTIAATIRAELPGNLSKSTVVSYQLLRRNKSTFKSVLHTIAFNLAKFDPIMAKPILKAVNDKYDHEDLPKEAQIKTLILDPLGTYIDSPSHPMTASEGGNLMKRLYFFLDALDECDHRDDLCKMLSKMANCIQRRRDIRIFLTSRPEEPIVKNLSCSSMKVIEMHVSTGQDDVRRYISERIKDDRDFSDGFKENGPELEAKIDALSEKADGLFVYAQMSLDLILGGDTSYFKGKFDRLNDVLSGTSSNDLTKLYETALSSSLQWEECRQDFIKVMGFLVCRHDGLLPDQMDELLGLDQGTSLKIIERTRSLIELDDSHMPFFTHATVSEFLTDENRRDKAWFVNLSDQETFIAEQCTQFIMQYDGNTELVEGTSPHYSILHWDDHIGNALFSEALAFAVSELDLRSYLVRLYELVCSSDTWDLYFFRSFIKEAVKASVLPSLAKWLSQAEGHKDLVGLIKQKISGIEQDLDREPRRGQEDSESKWMNMLIESREEEARRKKEQQLWLETVEMRQGRRWTTASE